MTITSPGQVKPGWPQHQVPAIGAAVPATGHTHSCSWYFPRYLLENAFTPWGAQNTKWHEWVKTWQRGGWCSSRFTQHCSLPVFRLAVMRRANKNKQTNAIFRDLKVKNPNCFLSSTTSLKSSHSRTVSPSHTHYLAITIKHHFSICNPTETIQIIYLQKKSNPIHYPYPQVIRSLP